MGNFYGGRLGRVIAAFPKQECPKCYSPQVQIISYLSGDPEWKCRKCKHIFTRVFEDNDARSDEYSK